MTGSTAQKIKNWLKTNRLEIAISLAIFFIALLPRIINLTGHSVFVDELKWFYRSKLVSIAFRTLNFTILKKGWWDFNDSIAIGLPASTLMAASRYLLKNWADPIFSYRFPITIIGSITPVVFYLMLKRIKQPQIGLIGALFLALEPVFIAMSRWAHQDVTLTFLFFVSLGLFYIGETEGKFYLKVLSAFVFSLAFLTKLNALIIPVVIISWKVLYHFRNSREKRYNPVNAFDTGELVLPCLAIVTIFLLWPALWGNPFATVVSYLKGQAQSLSLYYHRNVFLGEVTVRPAFYYYPVILLIRLSPIALIAVFFGWGNFALKKREKQFTDFWLLNFLWLLIYIVVMSLSQKKLEVRYVLGVWPALAFFVGYGLYSAFTSIKSLSKNQAAAAGVGLLMLFEVPVAFIYSPNFYLYYNFIAGGPAGARKSKITLVGQGEAAKPLALFVAKKFKGKDIKIVHYGHPKPFLTYLPDEFKANYKMNTSMSKDGKYVKYYYQLKKIYPRNFDLIIIESQWADRSLSPTPEQVLETGKYKLIYVYKFAGAELGWVFERKSGT